VLRNLIGAAVGVQGNNVARSCMLNFVRTQLSLLTLESRSNCKLNGDASHYISVVASLGKDQNSAQQSLSLYVLYRIYVCIHYHQEERKNW
jgi:hypothetical protein